MLEDIKLPFIDKKVINKYEREYQIGLIDGQGVMTSIDIYPGIQVIYNNFHCFTAPTDQSLNRHRYIEINHCLKVNLNVSIIKIIMHIYVKEI